MKGKGHRCSAVVATLVFGAALAAAAPPPSAWVPPPQGAVAMFRQGERAFAVGGGGAGGVAARPAPPALREEPDVAVIHLAPIAFWDHPDGPGHRRLPEGTVRFYRNGDERPLVTAAASEPAELPAGGWWLMAEAPGYASTASAQLTTGLGAAGLYELTIGVVPACRVRLAESPAWESVRRLDVVSITESTVYPLHPPADRERWVAVGEIVSYAHGHGGDILAVGPRLACREGETLALEPPRPPPAGRSDLLALFELSRAAGENQRGEVRVTLRRPGGPRAPAPAAEAALVWTGRRGAAFFVGLEADAEYLLRVERPGGAAIERPVPPGGGVHRLDLGRLEEAVPRAARSSLNLDTAKAPS